MSKIEDTQTDGLREAAIKVLFFSGQTTKRGGGRSGLATKK